MKVHFSEDVQHKLTQLAAEQGRPSETLIVEAVERMVNYDAWFLREVDEGVEAADRGDLLSHEEVRNRIDRLYPG